MPKLTTMRPRRRIYQTSLWKRTRLAVLERDGYRCRLNLQGCTSRATTVDHVVPLIRGGRPFDPSNLIAACRHCNTSKADRPARSTPAVFNLGRQQLQIGRAHV